MVDQKKVDYFMTCLKSKFEYFEKNGYFLDKSIEKDLKQLLESAWLDGREFELSRIESSTMKRLDLEVVNNEEVYRPGQTVE